MKLCLANYHLTLHEFLATSGNLDKIINFDFIENGLNNNFDMEQKESEANTCLSNIIISGKFINTTQFIIRQ
jgi:hypothetical protein